MHEIAGEVGVVKFVQVKISQIVIGDFLRQHVIDSDQDFVRNSDRCPLVAASGFKTVELNRYADRDAAEEDARLRGWEIVAREVAGLLNTTG